MTLRFSVLSGLATVAFLTVPTSAEAISGTVTGCILFDDERNQTSSLTGSRHVDRSGGALDPITGARVQVLGGGGGSVGESTTGSNGCFTINWNDILALWFPTTGYRLRVELRDPNDFRVTNENGTLFAYATNIVLNDSNENLGSFSLADDEQALVFQTAADYWDRLVDPIAVLSSRMTNVRISATVPFGHDWGFGTICDTACMLDANHVSIPDTFGLDLPVTHVAHELGHATVTRGLDEGDFNVDPGCTHPAHTFTSLETCDSHPWNEGFANFFSVAFAFTNNATAAHFGGPGNSVETPEAVCATSATPRRIEACVTSALWDIFDDPTGDDDVMDGSPDSNATGMVSALDNYCWGTGNRCQAESGPHGRNAWDFLANFSATFPTLQDEVEDIYAACRIDIGGEEPFP